MLSNNKTPYASSIYTYAKMINLFTPENFVGKKLFSCWRRATGPEDRGQFLNVYQLDDGLLIAENTDTRTHLNKKRIHICRDMADVISFFSIIIEQDRKLFNTLIRTIDKFYLKMQK